MSCPCTTHTVQRLLCAQVTRARPAHRARAPQWCLGTYALQRATAPQNMLVRQKGGEEEGEGTSVPASFSPRHAHLSWLFDRTSLPRPEAMEFHDCIVPCLPWPALPWLVTEWGPPEAWWALRKIFQMLRKNLGQEGCAVHSREAVSRGVWYLLEDSQGQGRRTSQDLAGRRGTHEVRWGLSAAGTGPGQGARHLPRRRPEESIKNPVTNSHNSIAKNQITQLKDRQRT